MGGWVDGWGRVRVMMVIYNRFPFSVVHSMVSILCISVDLNLTNLFLFTCSHRVTDGEVIDSLQ